MTVNGMRRRAVLALLAAPMLARSGPRPSVGVLSWHREAGSWEPKARRGFLDLMAKLGLPETKVAFDWRYAERDLGRLEAQAADLVRTRPDVMLAFGSLATQAATRRTASTPVVCGCLDAIREGYTRSLARPTGNVTGYTEEAGSRAVKLLEHLGAVVPRGKVVLLTAPRNPVIAEYSRYFVSAAREVGVLLARGDIPAIDGAREFMSSARADGVRAAVLLSEAPDDSLVKPALDAGVALVEAAFDDGFVERGGLLSYRAPLDDFFERVARQLEKVLRGTPVREIPFEQPSRFRLELNAVTAARLGLRIPPALLLQADRVFRVNDVQ